MTNPRFRRTVGTLAVLVALGLGVTHGDAQPAPGGILGFIKLSPSDIGEFKADPAKFLDKYKSGGLPLSNEIKDLVLSDSSLLGDILASAKSATSVQGAAIGAGLAEAARAASPTDPQLAGQIQTQVLISGLAEVLAAYTAISNSTVTASTGGGGAGGGGGGGGGGVGGPVGGVGNSGGSNSGTNPAPAWSGVANSSSFNAIGFGGSPPSGGAATAATASVSPTTSTTR